MDPITAFGVATGVIGLLPLVASGFAVIKGVIRADSALKDITVAWGVEETRYLTFQKQLELDGVQEADTLKALKRKAPEIQHAIILRCLAAISNMFADSKVLTGYGLQLNVHGHQEQTPPNLPLEAAGWKGKADQLIQGRKTRMNIFRRSKLVLHDSDKIKDLIVQLKTYLDDLFSTCTYLQMQTFANILIPDMLSMSNVMELLDNLLASQKNNPDPQQQATHDLLRRTANFAAQVKATQSQHFVAMENKFQISESWAVPSKADEIGTMALWGDLPTQDETRVYYIEWKSVESHTGGIDARLEANVASLTKIASLKEVPPELRVLPCLGAFKTSGLRYGLVYQLPFHLRDFRRSEGKPGDLSRRRKPTSLLSLLQSPDHRIPEALDLGSRIKLAQGIAQSLLLLQSVEWVHKNVCSQSIIFFLASSHYGNLPSTTGRLDFDHPYLCGFGQARPENPTTRVTSGDYPLPQLRQTSANLYQHPYKRENPQSHYQPSYDVYSLGCVMLEIGLWQSISSLAEEITDESPRAFRDRLVVTAHRELPGQAGRIYANATIRCLQMSTTEQNSKKPLQQVIEELGSLGVDSVDEEALKNRRRTNLRIPTYIT